MRIKMALSVASILVTQNLLLANETTKLDDVQVVTSASGFEQNVADAPASISVITADELQKKSYTDVIDAVNFIVYSFALLDITYYLCSLQRY